MPQALTRFGSVKVATPGWSETRFSCRNVPVPAAPAGTANAPANASDSAAAMKPRFMTMTRLLDVGWPAPAIVSPATRAHQPPAGTPSDGTSTGGASSSTHPGHGTVARRPTSPAADSRCGYPGELPSKKALRRPAESGAGQLRQPPADPSRSTYASRYGVDIRAERRGCAPRRADRRHRRRATRAQNTTRLKITRPRRSSKARKATSETPQSGLEITAGTRANCHSALTTHCDWHQAYCAFVARDSAGPAARIPPGGDIRPFTCDPRRAEDGSVTASRSTAAPAPGRR